MFSLSLPLSQLKDPLFKLHSEGSSLNYAESLALLHETVRHKITPR